MLQTRSPEAEASLRPHEVEPNLRWMTTAALTEACRDQSDRFLRDEPTNDEFALELVRRAICQRDDVAWQALVSLYRRLVITSIARHPLAQLAAQDEDDWVYRTFERFWRAVDADRLRGFGTMAAVLGYLKLCAHSVLMDSVRSRCSDRFTPLKDEICDGSNAGDHVIGDLVGEQLWDVISQELPDASDRTVAYLSFVRNLRPAEVQARRPELFPSMADVYRVKRNVLDRLRRSARVQSFLVID